MPKRPDEGPQLRALTVLDLIILRPDGPDRVDAFLRFPSRDHAVRGRRLLGYGSLKHNQLKVAGAQLGRLFAEHGAPGPLWRAANRVSQTYLEVEGFGDTVGPGRRAAIEALAIEYQRWKEWGGLENGP